MAVRRSDFVNYVFSKPYISTFYVNREFHGTKIELKGVNKSIIESILFIKYATIDSEPSLKIMSLDTRNFCVLNN